MAGLEAGLRGDDGPSLGTARVSWGCPVNDLLPHAGGVPEKAVQPGTAAVACAGPHQSLGDMNKAG